MASRYKIAVSFLFLQALVAAVLIAPAAAAPARPAASFGYTPPTPYAGEAVIFDASTSSAPNGPIVSYHWDFGDGSQQTYNRPFATHTYMRPGSYRVTLKVTGPGGPSDTGTATRTLTVSAPPPGAPPPSLRPTCSDGVDNDGDSLVDFPTDGGCTAPEDGSEVDASLSPAADCADGADNDGDGSTDFPGDRGCTSASDPTEADVAGTPALALLTPFPIVRIVGSTRGSGGWIRLLAVRAPARSAIEVRCRGGGCPRSPQTKRLRASGRVTFPRFQRYFAAGAALGIYVRKPGLIGKYTRFRIRSHRRPARIDRCLLPGRARPVPCPTGPARG